MLHTAFLSSSFDLGLLHARYLRIKPATITDTISRIDSTILFPKEDTIIDENVNAQQQDMHALNNREKYNLLNITTLVSYHETKQFLKYYPVWEKLKTLSK